MFLAIQIHISIFRK